MSYPTKFVAAVALTVLATAQSVLVEMSKVDGKIPFHTPTAVLYTEILKLVISLVSLLFNYGRDLHLVVIDGVSKGSVLYAVPALLFIVQNNLNYRAMQLLDPPTFQLWACWKLVPAGIFARIFLGQQYTSVQWSALVLLVLGMATTKLDMHPGVADANDQGQVFGISILLLNGCLSGFSGVLNEWLIKAQNPMAPLMWKNAQLYFFCVLVAAPSAMLSFSWSPLAVIIVVVNACTGLCVSAVLKYADNVIKGFSTSAAVLCAALLSILCCGFVANRAFVVGSLIVCVSFYQYFGGHNHVLIAPTGSKAESSSLLANASEKSALETDSEKTDAEDKI